MVSDHLADRKGVFYVQLGGHITQGLKHTLIISDATYYNWKVKYGG